MEIKDIERLYKLCLCCKTKRPIMYFIIKNKQRRTCKRCILKNKYYRDVKKNRLKKRIYKYPPLFYKDKKLLLEKINNMIDQFNIHKIQLDKLFNFTDYYNDFHNMTLDQQNDLLDELIFYYNLKI